MKYQKTKPNQLKAVTRRCMSCFKQTLFTSAVLPGNKPMCEKCEAKLAIAEKRFKQATQNKRSKTQTKIATKKPSRGRRGSNQYQTKRRTTWFELLIAVLLGILLYLMLNGILNPSADKSLAREAEAHFASPVPADAIPASPSATPTPSVEQDSTGGEDAPSELERIVAYIARTFEPEGKDVVVRAINCFYSESGLRRDAVGQNSDAPRSKDHGIAQLNDYWHKLTEAQKTDIKANIDKAYEIYKGRGGNFSAWYGKLCN